MPLRHPRPTAPLLLTLALYGCGPVDDVDPDGALDASDDAVVDATADALADAAAGPDAAPAPALGQRFPWGAHFDADAAAADCAADPAPSAWWCGGREAEGGDAAVDDAWLAFRLTDDPCPPAPGWVVEAPFDGIGHPDLERVCTYGPGLEGPAQVEALPDTPALRLERDRQVVAPHALPAEVWKPLEQAWQTQMNLPDWDAGPNPEAGSVRVAIIDSTPAFLPGDGPAPGLASTHGLVMGNVVRAVACPNRRGEAGPCSAGLMHELALPRVFGDSFMERGGHFGTQGEFAVAVASALRRWRDAGQAQPLILNLSLGWTAMHGGALDDDARLGPQLGLWVLDQAACDGALAIAAAGNRAHADGAGATYPAAWTGVPSLCDPERPPVYAVGGVDGRDLPLGVARPGSHPRLVAPAAHVLLRQEGETQPAGDVPLSGTSLAAAAASGAAALVWAWRPELDAAAVMALLYASGAPVEGLADIDLHGPMPRRRLDVCASLDLACAEGDCVVPPPACLGRPADARADHAALLQALHGDGALVEGEAQVAAESLDVADAPYATPQPSVPQCPYCGIGGGFFYGELTELPDGVLTQTTLHIHDGLDGVQIPLPDLPPGVSFKVDIGYDDEVKAAWLSGQVWADGKLVQTASEIAVGE